MLLNGVLSRHYPIKSHFSRAFLKILHTAKQQQHIDGLVQERRNSSALAMELHLSCINPSISNLKLTKDPSIVSILERFCYIWIPLYFKAMSSLTDRGFWVLFHLGMNQMQLQYLCYMVLKIYMQSDLIMSWSFFFKIQNIPCSMPWSFCARAIYFIPCEIVNTCTMLAGVAGHQNFIVFEVELSTLLLFFLGLISATCIVWVFREYIKS